MNTATNVEAQPWEKLVELAELGNTDRLEQYIESIGPSESFRALLRLEVDQRERVLTTLSPQEAADLMEEIPEELRPKMEEAVRLCPRQALRIED